MSEEVTIFEIMRTVLVWLSPLVFLEGILLLLAKEEKYNELEVTLGKEVGGFKKRLIPQIETNIFTFQKWLLKRKFILGVFCILYSAMLFIVLRK